MKVILTEDVTNLGSCGEMVDVKTGYARNYLMPRNLAIPATKGNLRAIDNVKQQKELRDKKRRRGAEKVRDDLEKLVLTAELVTDDEGKVFGSVTARAVAALVEKAGHKIDWHAVQLEEAIKALGIYTVKIKVEKDVTANVKLFVEKKAS